MAAASLVGGAFLSATLKVLFAKMASQEVVDFIRGRKVPDTLLKKLKTTYLALHAVLNDAEEKEFTNLQIKEWLDELKDAVYDAEDILDEIAAGALQCQLEAKSKLQTSLPTAPAMRELTLKNCNDVFLKELPPTLQTLRMGGFNNLESLSEGVIDCNLCPEMLIIFDCPVLKSLAHVVLSSPTTPKVLGIYKCRELQFPLYQCYSSLKRLFINDSCSSLISIPLDIFPKLDYLQIKSCCNMESLLVSEGHQPIDLVWLEIEDCLNLVAFPSGGLLALSLTRLKVNNCPRLNSLPQNMHTLLPSLELLEIINCPRIESFPEGGLPSNLINISIGDCKKLISTRMEWGLQRLQCLKTLLFGNVNLDCWDVESFPKEDLLPTSLRILAIVGFRKLISLDNNWLQHLTSLQQLFIIGCPELKHMPEDGLPCSISYLEIEDCPSLTKLFQRKKGKEWRNIAHIPTIKIDGQVII